MLDIPLPPLPYQLPDYHVPRLVTEDARVMPRSRVLVAFDG